MLDCILYVIISAIVGALIRRWWGGWFSPNHLFKLCMVSILYGCLSFLVTHTIALSILSGIAMTIILTNTLHGEGMNMGYEHKVTPLWKCLIIMSGSYAGYMFSEGILWSYFYANWWYLLYSAFGIMIALWYWFIWSVYPRNADKVTYKMFIEWPKGNYFLDGPCSAGELGLGAITFSALFLLHFILR